MKTTASLPGRSRQWVRAAAGLLLAGVVLGCQSGQGGSLVSGDIYAIKTDISKLMEAQESGRRTLDYRLETLEEKVQSRNDLLNTNLTEIEKRLREQNDEILGLRKEIGELTFQLDALRRKLDVQAAQLSPTSSALLETAAAGEAAYNEALRQFNLGRYDLARQGFEKALGEGATGDLAIQARFWLGEACYKQPDLTAAYDHYTRLIWADPTHPLAWRGLERLAEIRVKQGQPAEALRFYEEIIRSNPGYEGIQRVKENHAALQAGRPTPAPPEGSTAPPGN